MTRFELFKQEHQGKHFCACGCGQEIIIKRKMMFSSYGISKCIPGHNIIRQKRFGAANPNYGKGKWEGFLSEHHGKHICQCGCGEMIIIRKHHTSMGIPKFINGHYSRIRGCSIETRKKLSEAQRGKRHSIVSCQKMSRSRKGRRFPAEHCQNISHALIGRDASHGKGCWYKGIWLRSSWELIFAQYQDMMGIEWQYEPEAFPITYFHDDKQREGTYRPDFYLPKEDIYYEVKGYWRGDGKAKFYAFIAQHPNLKIKLVKKAEIDVMRLALKQHELAAVS